MEERKSYYEKLSVIIAYKKIICTVQYHLKLEHLLNTLVT